jgi:hypothetical protein
MVPKRIIVHHSKTKDSETVSASAIRRYHVTTMGWSAIGYHFLVEMVGDHIEVFVGRPLHVAGAHTRGQNRDSIGICFIGDYDEAVPSYDMLNTGADLIAGLCSVLGIPEEEIHSHNKFAGYKSCPGTKFPLDGLIELVRSKI